MQRTLTLEADSVNVQALNMGRIVVDIDGVNLAELINMICDNGYSLRVVDESDRTSADCTPPFAALTGIRCSTAHITETDNTGCTRCRIRRMTPANQNGFILQAEGICYVPMLCRIRCCTLNVWPVKTLPPSGCHSSSGVMASVLFIWMPAPGVCRIYPLSTGNQKQHEIINHGNSAGYSDCVAAGQYRL